MALTWWQRAWPLARKDIAARYRGSVLGLAWALAAPLALVVIYAAVFQGVFNARWPSADGESAADFALRLYAGLMVFTAVAETATRAARLMPDHANLVKRVVFPLDLLVVALVQQAGVHAALQSLVLGGLILAYGGEARWSWFAVPLVWGWVLAMLLGVGWLLAALGCYLRDLQHLLPPLFGGLLFLSPVFYPRDAAPVALRWALDANPLTMPIEALRAAWFGGSVDTAALALALAGALVLAASGLWLFRRLRPGFADLL